MVVLDRSATLPWAAERPDPDELFHRPPWMADAACRGQLTDLWFPSKGQEQEPAKTLCAVCPVRTDCLDYALASPELRGVWGGMGERERVRMRRASA
jgi:WhiB family redox-sensing transcriptional regulator